MNFQPSYRKLHCCLLLLFFFSWNVFSQEATNIPNPVLPGVADAGVIKYNGEYYIGGVFTRGSFYHSEDMVNWKGPVHVFSMNNAWTSGPSSRDSEIHANDLNYINGVFHQYWSVNYWGKDQHVVHIGHATSTDIFGPYHEPDTATWFENRIDPALFIDDNGKPYLYMVKFTDGNTIWGRSMKDPWTFEGDPEYLFASLPNTWETLDNRVAEGPFVIKYRNQYYMMYNTNHTSTRWGNYMLGVAQAESPLGFNHGNKYSHPVVESNQQHIEENFVDLLNFSENDPGVFIFTTHPPEGNWKDQNYDALNWEKGIAGFGSQRIKNSTTRNVETDWSSDQIWLRKSFTKKSHHRNLMLRIHHDGDTKIYLNGQIIYDKKGSDYLTWNFDSNATSLLKDGENLLAITSSKGDRSSFLDIFLFDIKDQIGDDILFSPGQPNIVRGPNGFEWWLIYMANKNQESRGQYINRVNFFNKKLSVEGPSSDNTPSYHPIPAQPTFKDLFNHSEETQLHDKWNIKKGDWSLSNNELVQTSESPAEAFIKSKPATHYLFEANLKSENSEAEKAGVIAWWKDENNWMRVELDHQNNRWGYSSKVNGTEEKKSYALPDNFNHQVFHKLSIFKNSQQIMILIDDLPAPEKPTVILEGSQAIGIPGLYTSGSRTAFDGVIYTIGWDEFDNHISGWIPSPTIEFKTWEINGSGMTSPDSINAHSVFKGDDLGTYEISAQITNEGSKGKAGVYPIYIDEGNYLKTTFDFDKKRILISGKTKGEIFETLEAPLEKEQIYYADMKYSDFIEKHFTFDSPTTINSLRLSKTPHNQPNITLEDIHQKMNIYYKKNNQWHPLKNIEQAPSPHPGYVNITFDSIEADGLKFINKKGDDHQFYIYKIWVNQQLKRSYNLKAERTSENVIIWIDGKEVLKKSIDFPNSRVGLFTEKAIATFNGITLFHKEVQ